jgi:hypothetical protein
MSDRDLLALLDGIPDRPMTAEPVLSPMGAAVEAYRARFGDTPWTWDLPPGREAAWIAAIHQAARTGEALTEGDLERVTGRTPPPPGAVQ